MKQRLILAAGVIALCTSVSSEASVLITVWENVTGTAVIAQASGTLNLAALGAAGSSTSTAGHMNPGLGLLVLGPGGTTDVYFPSASPSSFGPSFTTTSAAINTGNVFGVGSGQVLLPTGYTSGSILAMTGTWNGFTTATLGLTTPGTYTWSWGSGGTADHITMNVGGAAPEPETYALFAFGLGAAEWLRRRKRKMLKSDA